jgi:predicted DNA-binding transcriptional regulator AlpA
MTIIHELTPDQLREVIASVLHSELAKLPKQEPERLLTRKEASQMLGVSLPTLNAWEKSGYVQPKRIGNRVYYRNSDLVK